MNKEVKEKWLKALRSGEYKQASGQLTIDGNFCCLGVLCDIHSKEFKIKWHEGVYLGASGVLPDSVMNWAGLTNDIVPYEGKYSSLMMANDRGYSFEEIANIIENQL